MTFLLLWSQRANYLLGTEGFFDPLFLLSILCGFALGFGIVAKSGPGRRSAARFKFFGLWQFLAVVWGSLVPTLLESLLPSLGQSTGVLVFGFAGLLLGALIPLYEGCRGSEGPWRGASKSLSLFVLAGAFLGAWGLTSDMLANLGQWTNLTFAALAGLCSAALSFYFASQYEGDSELVLDSPPLSVFPPLLGLFSFLGGAVFFGLLLLQSQVIQLTLGRSELIYLLTAVSLLMAVGLAHLLARFFGRDPLSLAIVGACLSLLSLMVFMRGVPGRQAEFFESLTRVSRNEGSLFSVQLQSLFWGFFPLFTGLSLLSVSFFALFRSPVGMNGARGLRCLGGAAGAALTAYVLVPSLGFRASFFLWMGLLTVLAFLVAWTDKERRARRLSVVIATGILAFAMTNSVEWPERSLIHAKGDEAVGNSVVFYQVNHSSIISVDDDEDRNIRTLRRDGRFLGAIPIDPKKDSSADLSSSLAQAAYPVLLAPKPESICVIGLDTGVLLGALLTYEVKKVDAVESRPLIIEALRDKGELFSFMNNRALDDERLSLHSADPVYFLMSHPKQYDVICSKPLHPWVTNNARFHTQDYYALVKSALTEEGIFCLSFAADGLDDEGLKTQLGTFLTVFPDAVVFRPPGTSTVLVLGGVQKISIDDLRKRLGSRGRKKARKRRSTHPRDLLSCFISGPESLKSLTAGAEIETVENSRLQRRLSQLGFVPSSLTEKQLFDLSRGSKELLDWLSGSLFQRHQLMHACAETRALRGDLESAQQLIKASFDRVKEMEKELDRQFISSQGHRLLGDLIFRNARSLSGRDLEIYTASAFREWESALKINPKNVAARRSISVYHLNRRDFQAAIGALEPGLTGKRKADAPLQFVMGRIYEAQKNYQLAWAAYKEAGNYGQARERAANVLNLAEQAGTPIQRPLGPRLKDIPLLVDAGRRYLNEKKWVEAAKVFQKVIEYQPDTLSHRYRLAYAYRGGKAWDRAHKVVDEILKRKATEVRALQLRASLYDQAEEPKKALAAWQDCAKRQEGQFSSVKSLTEVARLHIGLGQSKEALEALRKASVLVPENVLVELYRGTAYAALGEKRKATTHYEKYLKLSPGTHSMRRRIERWLAENKSN
ncbi:MAG: tetratricopeptide repeat protein [Planctomycetota bacterium]|nr:tetratricopeptide repeat protein [Planctomycetota bacterium]